MADLGENIKNAALGLYCPIWKSSPVQAAASLAGAALPYAGVGGAIISAVGTAAGQYLTDACTPITGPANPPNGSGNSGANCGLAGRSVEYRRTWTDDSGFSGSTTEGPGPASFTAASHPRDGYSVTFSNGVIRGTILTREHFGAVSNDSGGAIFDTVSNTVVTCGQPGPPPGGYPPISPGDQSTINILAPILAGIAGLGLAGAAGVASILAGQAALAGEIAALAAEVAACCTEETALLVAILAKASKIDLETDGLRERLKKIEKIVEYLQNVLGFGTTDAPLTVTGRDLLALHTLYDCLVELYSILGFTMAVEKEHSFAEEVSVASLKEEFKFLRTKMGFDGKYIADTAGKPPVAADKQPHSIEAVVRSIKLGEMPPIYDTQNFLTDGYGSIIEIRPDQDFREISILVEEQGVYAYVTEFPNYLGREVLGEYRYNFGSYRYTDNSTGSTELLHRSQGERHPLAYTRQYIPGAPQGTYVRFKAIEGIRLRFTYAALESDRPAP